MQNNTRVITGVARGSYMRVFEADENGKYSASVIIPKSDKDTIARVNKAIENAITAGIASKFGGSRPKKLEISFKDGDLEREDEAYENSMYISAKSNRQPQVVDTQVQPILDQDEVYSGAYYKFALTFYPYNFEGKKGVACALDNIQKIKDGDALGGARHKAEDDFEAFNEFM